LEITETEAISEVNKLISQKIEIKEELNINLSNV